MDNNKKHLRVCTDIWVKIMLDRGMIEKTAKTFSVEVEDVFKSLMESAEWAMKIAEEEGESQDA